MPERTPGTRVLGAIAAGLLVGVLAAPGALAQTDEVPTDPGDQPEQQPPGSWGGSSFDEPFHEDDVTLRRASVDVSGTLRYRKTGPADFIDEVEVRVVDDPGDEHAPGEACALPAPVTIEGDGPGTGWDAEQRFEVLDVVIPCNGRYLVQAEGSLEDPDAPPHTMERSFVVAVLPESVTGLDVALDRRARSVTVAFQPLDPADVAPDAIGYVLERRGPAGGAFDDVASTGLDGEPRFVDPLTDAPAGAYTYRVRSVRGGADGEVRSSIIHTESATVSVEGDPTSATSAPPTTAPRSGALGASSGRRPAVTRTSSTPRLTTPTTLDTGFEDTIDYGEVPETTTSEELAGDEPVAGQSIVQDEADGVGVDAAVPAAGALVLLGWAGHIIYLNRLAKLL